MTHVPALAGCLASFCQSHTHPGGHFSIPAWLDPSETGATTKCALLFQTPHTPTFLQLPLSPPIPYETSRLSTGVSRAWNMSSRKTGPIQHPPTWVGPRPLWPSDSMPWNCPLVATCALTLFLQPLGALSLSFALSFGFLETDSPCNSGWPRPCHEGWLSGLESTAILLSTPPRC